MADNIRFLHGEDSFRLSRRVKFLREGFLKKYSDGEVTVLEEKATLEDARMACLTPNLFGGKRLVLLDHFWDKDKFEAAEKVDFFASVEDMGDLVNLVIVEGALDKRMKWTKFFLKSGFATETFAVFDESETVRWIIETTKKNEGTILMNDAKYLVDRCGVNLWHINNEIEKMVMATPDSTITKEVIDEYVLPRPSAVIWDFLESVSKQNTPLAFKNLKKLLGAGESVYQILAMMMREARIHAQLRYGASEGMDAKALATATKLHPFVVQKTIRLSRAFSAKQIETLYDGLWELDKSIKTGGVSSSTDDTSELELGLEKIIYTLCS